MIMIPVTPMGEGISWRNKNAVIIKKSGVNEIIGTASEISVSFSAVKVRRIAMDPKKHDTNTANIKSCPIAGNPIIEDVTSNTIPVHRYIPAARSC